ncbi:melanoma antigen preferentially expressed in tumors-like isoform X1 [Dipodomys merriami]|uniref:melanoma antigen preferentially expressed in tumors-like isoform X1 n=1 Tax=Dipodomys merriami TaxID=94247 RepID=UPI0038556818
MSVCGPPRLLELAVQSLLKDEALAIAALELLPMELFPPLFVAAYSGRQSKTLKAMVQAWPFVCLPLGALMKEKQFHQENFQAVLSGLDALLSQEVRPRRWRLQVLDLRKNAHQNFWTVWSDTRASLCSLMVSEDTRPVKTKKKVNGSRIRAEQALVPVEVFIDLSLKKGSCDQLLTSLIEKVKQKKGLLHLCCKKLSIFRVPLQNIKLVVKMIRLDSVQDLEVSCTWTLSNLGNFAPHLGQMCDLHRLVLSYIHISLYTSQEEEEHCVHQFSSQFLSLHHLQELCLDSIPFLQGRLHHVLRCLMSSLKILWITNCLLLESDLMYLSQCPNISELKDLDLSGVNLTSISLEPLRDLLERVSTTLQTLGLIDCGIVDHQLTVILPSLNHCSQLTALKLYGNPISMSMLKNLQCQNIRLINLSYMLYPGPLESNQDIPGNFHLERFAHLHNKLKWMLHELGQANMDWFSSNPCYHCGDSTFYDP